MAGRARRRDHLAPLLLGLYAAVGIWALRDFAQAQLHVPASSDVDSVGGLVDGVKRAHMPVCMPSHARRLRAVERQ